MTLDSHQHYWKYHPTHHAWIDESMSVLKRDFLPSHLHKELIAGKIDGSIAVQAAQTQEETLWLLELAQQNDFIKGVVGWIDLKNPALEENLIALSNESNHPLHKKLVGFRDIIQGADKEDFLANDHFIRGVKLLAGHDFTYDILIYQNQLTDAIRFVEKMPSAHKLILDHIAKPNIQKKSIKTWRRDIQEIAQFSNLYCKVSGLVTEASSDWQNKDFYPYLDVVFEYFSIDKLCFGSDWPVCLLAGSYQQVVEVLTDYLNLNFALDLKVDGKKAHPIFGDNARKFYGIE